ncbi:MAG: hypothetical protein WBC04_01115 [Candidatus Acidiferrales bacterium]
MTLYEVSQRSAEIFGRPSRYYIPHRLYYDLAVPSFRPNIHQFLALSRITNYRVCDWLTVFGFHLDDIPRLRLLLPWPRTVVLDSSVYDQSAWIPWFVERLWNAPVSLIAPLARILRRGTPKRAKELLDLNRASFLYAKVGRGENFAFPDLVPGNIVRVDTRRAADVHSLTGATPSRQVFLVEHGFLLKLGHLRRTGKDRIALCSSQFPFAQIELTLDREVRIHGVVDAEIRPLLSRPVNWVETSAATVRPRAWLISDSPKSLKQLIRSARMKTGLSFRQASAVSGRIADLLADEMYFAAIGTLSDYETASVPPRHIQKIISLCILYGIRFWDFLRASDLQVEPLAGDPMPDEFVSRLGARAFQRLHQEQDGQESHDQEAGFLRTFINQWEELPLFTKDALDSISGLKNVSLSDVFWIGGDPRPIHPYLMNASLLAVNRRAKNPPRSPEKTFWQQPLYVAIRRNGSYLCGACVLEQGQLVVYPYTGSSLLPGPARTEDAEVVGQVTAVLRRLG